MQFMSQSTGWADNIILAMAPLGIITAIVGAIRVGGPKWLRAVIGRARESRAVVEAELMSSTSHEVCELWNGQEIVRVMGAGPIREFIILLPEELDGDGSKVDRDVSVMKLERHEDPKGPKAEKRGEECSEAEDSETEDGGMWETVGGQDLERYSEPTTLAHLDRLI